MPKCSLCKKPATTHFALAPVCQEHRDDLLKEAGLYYRKTIARDEREFFERIRHLTPWRKRSDVI